MLALCLGFTWAKPFVGPLRWRVQRGDKNKGRSQYPAVGWVGEKGVKFSRGTSEEKEEGTERKTVSN